MDAAIQTFLISVAIVGGMLSPIFVLILIALLTNYLNVLAKGREIYLEELKKQPPFEEVEVNVSPDTNVMTVMFIKNDEIVWKGSSSRRQMEDDESIHFTSEDKNNG